MTYLQYPDNICPRCNRNAKTQRCEGAICVPVKCGYCNKYDYATPSCTRCNDCCFGRRRDVAGRLLANRCVACCPSGHGKHEPLGTILIDLAEQIELLEGLEHNLEGRILAVDTPQLVVSHAEMLERNAEELFDKAQQIRKALQEDTENVRELLLEMMRTQLTIATMRSEMQRGVRKSVKGYISKIVDRFLNERFG